MNSAISLEDVLDNYSGEVRPVVHAWTEAHNALRHVVEKSRATGLEWEHVVDREGRLVAKWSKKGRRNARVVVVRYDQNREVGRDIYNLSSDQTISDDATCEDITTLVTTPAAALMAHSGTPQPGPRGTLFFPVSETVFGADGNPVGSQKSEIEASADLVGNVPRR